MTLNQNVYKNTIQDGKKETQKKEVIMIYPDGTVQKVSSKYYHAEVLRNSRY